MVTPGTAEPVNLSEVVQGTPYQAYTYSYPHKTAYRVLPAPKSLTTLWSEENRKALFLYLHVPFCEHRCGFCNLFTQAQPESGLTTKYLDQLAVEASEVRAALGEDVKVQQLAIGGGTPTFLDESELLRLIRIVETFGVDGKIVATAVEVSPATVTSGKLKLLKEFGTNRLSIGIQSFDEAESRRLGRPQKTSDVVKALELIRDHEIPILNLDLIYGGEGQSLGQWMTCVREAVRWNPEELYLYPLYVRPLTGLGKLDRTWDDQRLFAYREARDYLISEGYQQVSMRMFAKRPAVTRPAAFAAEYHCQTDGMIGLGCGARSYTSNLHYSTEYAVGRRGVRSILADYIRRDRSSFRLAQYGISLTAEDQQRRFAIMGLLQVTGLQRSDYSRRFGRDVLEDLPEMRMLPEYGLGDIDSDSVRLTRAGLERSDAIGPWLYSERVRVLMQEYDLT